MTIYQSTMKNLYKKGAVCKLYRFENNNYNSNKINIKPNGELVLEKGYYIYFSKTIDHHKYFIKKRMLQDLKILVKQELNKNIQVADFIDETLYHTILSLIQKNYQLFSYRSYELYVLKQFQQLVEKCAISNLSKSDIHRQLEYPEVSDKRRHQGAYGIKGDWSSLLENSTLHSNCVAINYKDMINMINAYRVSYYDYAKKKLVIPPSKFEVDSRYVGTINQKMLEPFHRYDLLCILELIDQHIPLGSEIEYYLEKYIKIKEYTKEQLEEYYLKKIQ